MGFIKSLNNYLFILVSLGLPKHKLSLPCLFLLLILTFKSLAQTNMPISIKVKKQPIESILEQIEKKYNYHFAFSADKINLKKVKSINVQDVSIVQLLDALFYNTPIAYQIAGTEIILYVNSNATFTVSGYIREAGTGELLIGVLVGTNKQVLTTSNAYGFFSLTLPNDTHVLSFNYLGFKNQLNKVVLNENLQLTVNLNANSQLSEVVIKGAQNTYQRTLNTIEIPLKEIANIPSILGEKDPVKYLMLMPGIQKGSEGNNNLYVRGGGPDQNLILIDDAVIYNAYHLLGLASLITGSELKSAELTKGGFSSKYGGRISSILNMSLKDGNREKVGAELNIGLLTSKILVEGPIKKHKASYMLSARHSYIHKVAKLAEDFENGGLNYYFYDLHGKTSTEIGKKDRLMLSAYAGYDRFDLGSNPSNENIIWGNYAASLRWSRQYNNRLFSNTALTYTQYQTQINLNTYQNNRDQNLSTIQSLVTDKGIKTDFDFIPNTKHHIRFGMGYLQHLFEPTATVQNLNTNAKSTNGNAYFSNDAFAYIESQSQLIKNWKLIPGIRFSYFSSNTHYFRAEPRINSIYTLKHNWQINGSYSLMNQYVHYIPLLSQLGFPSDLWIGSSESIKPQRGQIITAGFFKKNIKNTPISFAAEVYYKTIENVTAIKDGASFLQLVSLTSAAPEAANVNDLLTQGKTNAYGIELMVKKEGVKFSCQLSYTLSRTEMQFNTLNNGAQFLAPYDRLHDIGVLLNFKANKRFTFVLSWIYGTGNPITLPVGEYFPINPVNGQTTFPQLYYDEKNNARLRAYHRLDLSIQYTHMIAKTIKSTIEFGLFNTYNRRNPLFYRIDSKDVNGTYERIITQTSLFPILPSLNWTLKF